jgi:glycerol uptake facilitator-like aquaporin
MPWLVISIVLSVILTVFLNVALRAFPDTSRRVAREVTRRTWPAEDTRTSDRRVRVWVPWKAMILGSVILTIVVNLMLVVAR